MTEDAARLRVLIVEDEPLGIARLTELLEEQEGVDLVGIAEDRPAAVDAIRALRPDLIFLDIQMPGGTGLDVVQEIGHEAMPATIFVTAYDRYALDAFRFAAVDYLLKPYSDERFEEAFRRARRKLKLEDLEKLREKLLVLLESGEADGDGRPDGNRYLERLAVHSRGRMRVVPVEEIDYIAASGVYAEIHVGEERHLLRESLQTLEEQLDPRDFFRIHRSSIVRLDRVEMLLRGAGGNYRVQLHGGVRLRVSRSKMAELEERLGGR